jgi:hypothetical protein
MFIYVSMLRLLSARPNTLMKEMVHFGLAKQLVCNRPRWNALGNSVTKQEGASLDLLCRHFAVRPVRPWSLTENDLQHWRKMQIVRQSKEIQTLDIHSKSDARVKKYLIRGWYIYIYSRVSSIGVTYRDVGSDWNLNLFASLITTTN